MTDRQETPRRSEPTLLPRVESDLEAGADGVRRTTEVVSVLRGFTSRIADMHAENGYVPKLRAIFRS